VKVLFIEDDREIVTSLSIIIETQYPGAEISSTHLGQTAITMLREQPFELVVLDLGLPDINGLDVLKEVRAFSSVPIIILTASLEPNNRTNGIRLGASDYLNKPFGYRQFVESVKAQYPHPVK
jgi:DNA-binding response OmpR family regulator